MQRGKRYNIVALNPAHPIYSPLCDYLKAKHKLKMADTQPAPGVGSMRLSADTLFGTALRMNVLAMLYLAGDEGIDGADLTRLLPQHDRGAMLQKIWDFCGLGIVVENAMSFGVIRYSLDPAFDCHEQLRALLAAVVKIYPNYKRTYEHREVLWPQNRATRERNRGARRQVQA
ncbi:MAG: hypothetical protein WB609_10295 [Candidatus Cybelea sp.]